jgi:hypothetical protein
MMIIIHSSADALRVISFVMMSPHRSRFYFRHEFEFNLFLVQKLVASYVNIYYLSYGSTQCLHSSHDEPPPSLSGVMRLERKKAALNYNDVYQEHFPVIRIISYYYTRNSLRISKRSSMICIATILLAIILVRIIDY